MKIDIKRLVPGALLGVTLVLIGLAVTSAFRAHSVAVETATAERAAAALVHSKP